MTLTNMTDFPPFGYLYKNPNIPWEAPNDLALQGLMPVARALQTVIQNNPRCGLNPSLSACVDLVKEYQCARFQNQPLALARFCGGPTVDNSHPEQRSSGFPTNARRASCCGRR